mmetsp:Transcript_23013/g.35233  ORF Transcript_23013/g.35233 Transcript_23013/m.35233 type:complete len:225 (-) Transcript_23013:315-989(-)
MFALMALCAKSPSVSSSKLSFDTSLVMNPEFAKKTASSELYRSLKTGNSGWSPKVRQTCLVLAWIGKRVCFGTASIPRILAYCRYISTSLHPECGTRTLCESIPPTNIKCTIALYSSTGFRKRCNDGLGASNVLTVPTLLNSGVARMSCCAKRVDCSWSGSLRTTALMVLLLPSLKRPAVSKVASSSTMLSLLLGAEYERYPVEDAVEPTSKEPHASALRPNPS